MTPDAASRPLDLGHILATLRDLERRLRAREAAMAHEIAAALAAATVVGRTQAEFDADLALAEQVHRSLIPRSWHGEDLTVEVRYRPMRGAGGDLCSILPAGPGRTFVSVADVTGHGVAAALLAARVAAHVRRLVEMAAGPAEVLRGLNDFLLAHFGDTGLFLTACAVLVDSGAGTLRFAAAGHPPALLLRRRTGTIARLGAQHTLLGVLPTRVNPTYAGSARSRHANASGSW